MTAEELADVAASLGLLLQEQKGMYRIKNPEDNSIVGYIEDAPGGWGLTLEEVAAFLELWAAEVP